MEKLYLWIIGLITVALWLAGLYYMGMAVVKGNVLFFVLYALPLVMVSTMLFIRYFLHFCVEDVVLRIFWTRSHLKEAPLMLASYYGDLARGDYEKVRKDMQGMPAKAFLDPEVVHIYAQACVGQPQYKREGIRVMEDFFRKNSSAENTEQVLALALYYADTARPLREPAAVCAVLENSLKKFRYSEHEKKAIKARCAALGGR